ncbi:hypothetical protein FOQG_19104 [Fusarium oxysporum f. sp. raphani 54005]|uniref:Uncharacterized protein n=2 Tax=Fusarium oxysporum TaxID=5507 RepID=X0BBE4_FUSOX|nr:hypothetical protein FOQG_19104 [Fusarium oxysporum f. sp. raphani 54005]EXL64281.1 hypothetical protein FOPG_19452 [Fusarium oxysporum f. sp. conglutinans race 2 54008]
MTPFLSRSLQSKQSVNCVVLTKLLSRSADFNSIRGVVDGCQSGHFTLTQKEDFGKCRSEHVVGVNGGKSKTRNDSTDHIIECGSSQGDGSIKMDDMDLKGNVIKKTVEFRVV